jgi:AraC family ethanolamine operon transcriptional activator
MPSGPLLHQFESDETGQFAQCCHEMGWSQDRTQLDAGPSRGHLHLVQTPHLTLIRESHTRGLLASSNLPPNQLAFGMLARGERPQRYNGRLFRPSDLVNATPGEPADLITRGSWSFDYLSVDRSFLERVSQAIRVCEVVDSVPSSRVLPTHDHVIDPLRRIVLRATAEVQCGVDSPAAVGELEEGIAIALLTTLGTLTRSDLDPAPVDVRGDIVTAGREYIEAHLCEEIRMSQLCRHVNTGIRYLQIAFRERIGISPYQYIRRRRLHLARQLLRGADCREVTVRQIARRVHCSHVGRFAVDYKRLFGESPSATLNA